MQGGSETADGTSTTDKSSVNEIVIVGGGTAGWMAAAALSEKYKEPCRQGHLNIRLIESSQIATVGVGEATVPGILQLHQHLGISEKEFIQATGATFKLGIEFIDWYQSGHFFFHPFAAFGTNIDNQAFYQCWLKLHKEGIYYNLEEFCLSIAMARRGRFAQPDDNATTTLALYSYAYHFDTSRYAAFLKKYARERGVAHIDAKVTQVKLNESSGYIEGVLLDTGEHIAGDLFIDCSGFKGLLIGEALATPYESWSNYLPCDRAIAVQSATVAEPLPYTRSTAMNAGWRWQIPLQQRMGNGYVYCSRYCDDEQARAQLLAAIAEPLLTEPRVIPFCAGMRDNFWNKNCVALGLASGFIEPLESTSISLIQTGIEKLLQFMPDLRIEAAQVKEANRLNRLEYERIRDFIILHYKASARDDSEFWRGVRAMEVPDSLQNKMDAFARDGSVLLMEQESFREQSWIAMYNGFKHIPRHCKAEVNQISSEKLQAVLEKMRVAIRRGAEVAPSHGDFLASVYS